MRSCLGIKGTRKAANATEDLASDKISAFNPASIAASARSGHAAVNAARPWTARSNRVAVTNTDQTVTSLAPPRIPKSPEVAAMIDQALRDNMLFTGLPDAALEVVIDSMISVSVAAGAEITQQGDIVNAHEFYVLEQGECEAWISGMVSGKATKVQTYKPGSAFGELALLFNTPRAATVRATRPCKLWVMQRAVFNAIRRNFTEAESEEMHKLLEVVPGIQTLPAHQRALLVDALTQVEFPAKSAVFHKNTPGNNFFLIKSGTAKVIDDGVTLARLGKGDYFGERALLGAEVRAADVIATSTLVCYQLSRDDFVALLGSKEELWVYEALKKVPLLYSLGDAKMWQLAHMMTVRAVAKDQVMFKKGDVADAFYIIQEGLFKISDEKGRCLANIGEGSCFGELALLNNDLRAATVVASSDAKVLVMSREQFNAELGDLGQMRSVWRFEVLRRVPLLNELEPAVLGELSQALETHEFKPGQDVVVEGMPGDKFYIVERGRLGAYKSSGSQAAARPGIAGHASNGGGSGGSASEKPVAMYKSGDYFGELSLLRDEPRAATVKALSAVCTLSVDREHFKLLMGPLLPILTKRAEKYKAGAVRSVAEVDLSQVQAIATLGSGGFGSVELVRHGGELYALKAMRKDFVVQQHLLQHVRREKEVMAGCNSPFLVRLRATAQDNDHVFFMMDAVLGGELFAFLQTRADVLSEDEARFYAASVVLGLEYLHERDHVYRDLKPENLLIDDKGYLRIADFGFVKQVRRGSKTYTTCGTPEYLAPEIIWNKGHNQAADWWALGVMIYELVSGTVPFYHQDRLTMFRRICSRELTFPKHFSKTLRDLILGLLELTPALRLGSGKTGVAEIKAHPWFGGLDWHAYAAKALPAPYVPKPVSKMNASTINFGKFPPIKQRFMAAQTSDRHQGLFADF